MRTLVLFVAFFIGLAGHAIAADDVEAGRTVIRSQEEAIGRDDAATAYSFAAPSIQSMYRDPDTFMYMVRQGYPPVYRHRSFEFGQFKTADGKIVQEVQIIDPDGVAWIAIYTLEQQTDGNMKISGCTLSKLVGA